MASAPTPLRVHFRSDAACIGSFDRYLFMRCYGEIPADAIHATITAYDACRAHGAVASLVLIDPATQFPSEDARAAAVEMIKKTKNAVCASATVVLGDGFWASALRGVLTTFNVLSAASHPTKTCRLPEEAVDWTLGITGDPSDTHRRLLLDALASMAPGAR